MYIISSVMPYFHAYTVLSLGINYEVALRQLIFTPAGMITNVSMAVTLPTGDRFHSTPVCVAVYAHAGTRKVAPLANTALPYLSWKSSVPFWWVCLAIICQTLRLGDGLALFWPMETSWSWRVNRSNCSCWLARTSHQVPFAKNLKNKNHTCLYIVYGCSPSTSAVE